MTTTRDPRLFVASLEKGMELLELFETAQESLSIADMTARTDLGRSAVQRFVHTWHELGYLTRDPDTRRYTLGPKILGLYRGYTATHSFLQHVHAALARLVADTSEAVSWAELRGAEIIVIDAVPSPHLTAVTLSPGMRFAAIAASSGQVLLAYAPPDAIAAAWAAAPPFARQRTGAADESAYAAHLATIRAQGYALTEKAFDQDSLSLSVPILTRQGTARGAINLSTLRARFTAETARAQLVPILLAAARTLAAERTT